jgi:hypothetical protein
MLVTSTDLEIPKDISKVGIQVKDGNGVERYGNWYTLGSRSDDRTELPATLAIIPGTANDPVHIRIFSQQRDGKIVTLSEATTTVPRDRMALLRMPIEWLSVGMVKPVESSSGVDAGNPAFPDEAAFASTVTTCDAGKTPRAGTCESAEVDSAALPTYTPGQVYGGGDGSGNGACFDTATCFATAAPLAMIDATDCLFDTNTVRDATADNAQRNLSLALVAADGSGICGSNGCIVPLDFVEPGGPWSGWTVQDRTKAKLPNAVCEKLRDGSLRAVVATTACSSKTPESPTCGPWSSVHSPAPTNSGGGSSTGDAAAGSSSIGGTLGATGGTTSSPDAGLGGASSSGGASYSIGGTSTVATGGRSSVSTSTGGVGAAGQVVFGGASNATGGVVANSGGGPGGAAVGSGGVTGGRTARSTLGGTTNVGGTTGSSTTYAACPPISTLIDGGTPSIAPLVVTPDGQNNVYVTSGNGLWYGYLMLVQDSAGSTVTLPTLQPTPDLTPAYCTAGSVMPGDLSSNPTYAGFGFYLQQSSTTREILTVSPASAGVNVQLLNKAGSPLFAQITGSSTTGAPPTWCAPILGSGGFIPWTAFNTKCWDGSGSPYRYEQIQSVAIVAGPSSDLVSTNFSYCLINIAETGSRSVELVSASGWVGGDANLTTDDPAGVQGGFYAIGDGVAYTAPSGNPCTADGCCIKGNTIFDPKYVAWGGSIGLDLGYFPSAQAEGASSVCPYRGDADCFDAVLTGNTGGNRLIWQAPAKPGLVADGIYPRTELPAFTNGWSGRVCFADFTCPSFATDCAITGKWYSLSAEVLGGERVSTFYVCLTSLRAVTND